MSTSSQPTVTCQLHGVVMDRGEWWIAFCLEHCFATQARTEEAVLADLTRMIRSHLFRAGEANSEPFATVPRAPSRYWQMYEDAPTAISKRLEVTIEAQGADQPLVELRAA